MADTIEAGRRLARRPRACQCLGELKYFLAYTRIGDTVIGAHELERLPLGHRIKIESRALLGEVTARGPLGRLDRHVVEKEGYRHIEHTAQLKETARANAIGASLVFLDLLEGETDRLAELFLAQSEHGATKPNATAHVDIDGIGFTSLHPG